MDTPYPCAPRGISVGGNFYQVDRSKKPLVYNLFSFFICFYLAVLVPKLEGDSCFFHCIIKIDCLIKCTGQPFFTVNMFPCFCSINCNSGMPMIRCCDYDGINIVISQQFGIVAIPGCCCLRLDSWADFILGCIHRQFCIYIK